MAGGRNAGDATIAFHRTRMHSHKLILEKDAIKAEWSLEWDESVFRLKSPDGQTALETDSSQAYRMVDLQGLYSHRKVSLATPEGLLTFKPQKAAAKELRCVVEAALRSDLDYRRIVEEQSRKATRLGLGMFFGGGVPFGLYCWWASWAPPPSPGLMQSVGWLIHLVLLLLMGLTLAGMSVAWFGISQTIRIRRIEADLSSKH